MMRTSRLLAVVAMMLPSAVHAQDALVEGEGHRIGGSAVLYPIVGAQAGVISNVFYTESDADPEASGIFRVSVGGEIRSEQAVNEGASDGDDGEAPARDFEYRFGLDLRYSEYLSSVEAVQDQRSLAVGANAGVTVRPGAPVSFFGVDNFTRSTREPNFESSGNLSRDVNRLRLGLRWRPAGRTLSGTFEYHNTIDRFEDSSLSFANRVHHKLRARVEWRYLPITRFSLQVSQGVYSSLGDGRLNDEQYKQSSFPLDVRLAADSAITELTTVKLHAGWGVGFYEEGATYGSAIFGAEFGYRYSPLGRLRLSFERRFNDSINANFYGDYAAKVGVKQQISRVVLDADVGYIRRTYEGIPAVVTTAEDQRSDNILSANAEARYHFNDWFAASAHYRLAAVSTDFRYSPPDNPEEDDPSYVRQEAVAGVQAAF